MKILHIILIFFTKRINRILNFILFRIFEHGYKDIFTGKINIIIKIPTHFYIQKKSLSIWHKDNILFDHRIKNQLINK